MTGNSVIYVNISEMAIMRDFLVSQGFKVQTSLRWIPLEDVIEVTEEEFESNMKAIEALEDLDDVDFIEHNINLIEA